MCSRSAWRLTPRSVRPAGRRIRVGREPCSRYVRRLRPAPDRPRPCCCATTRSFASSSDPTRSGRNAPSPDGSRSACRRRRPEGRLRRDAGGRSPPDAVTAAVAEGLPDAWTEGLPRPPSTRRGAADRTPTASPGMRSPTPSLALRRCRFAPQTLNVKPSCFGSLRARSDFYDDGQERGHILPRRAEVRVGPGRGQPGGAPSVLRGRRTRMYVCRSASTRQARAWGCRRAPRTACTGRRASADQSRAASSLRRAADLGVRARSSAMWSALGDPRAAEGARRAMVTPSGLRGAGSSASVQRLRAAGRYAVLVDDDAKERAAWRRARAAPAARAPEKNDKPPLMCSVSSMFR